MRIKTRPKPSLVQGITDGDAFERTGHTPSLSLITLRYRLVNEPPRRDRRTRVASVTRSEPDEAVPKMVTRGISSALSGDVDHDDESSIVSGINSDDKQGRRSKKRIRDNEESDRDVLMEMLANNNGMRPAFRNGKSIRGPNGTTPLLSHPFAVHPAFPPLTKMQETVIQAILDNSGQPCAFEDVCAYVARVRGVRRRDAAVQKETEDVLRQTTAMTDGTLVRLFQEDISEPGLWSLNSDHSILKDIKSDKSKSDIESHSAKSRLRPPVDVEPIPLTSAEAQRILGSEFTDLQALIVDILYVNGGKCSFDKLFDAVSSQWGQLRRRNGQAYTTDPRKSLLACLGKPMFRRVEDVTATENGVWALAPYVTELALASADGEGIPIIPATNIPVESVDIYNKKALKPFTDEQSHVMKLVLGATRATISYKDLLERFIAIVDGEGEHPHDTHRRALNATLAASTRSNSSGAAAQEGGRLDGSLFMKVDPALRMESATYTLSEHARIILSCHLPQTIPPPPLPMDPEAAMKAHQIATQRALQDKHMDLQAFLTILLRLLGGVAHFSQLLLESCKAWTQLRKKDGSKYSSDPRKAVQSALTGNTCPITLFRRHQPIPDHWELITEAAEGAGLFNYEENSDVIVSAEQASLLRLLLVSCPFVVKTAGGYSIDPVNRDQAEHLVAQFDAVQDAPQPASPPKKKRGGRGRGRKRRRIV